MSSPQMKIVQKNAPPLTNSIQMLRRSQRGRRREQDNKAGKRTCKKIVASECFGLSRVRCAG